MLKSDEPPEIALAIRSVAAGRQYLCSELSVRRRRQVVDATTPGPVFNPYNFSPREFELLHLLADGLTTTEIAARLLASRRAI